MEEHNNENETGEQEYTLFDDVANKLTTDFNAKFSKMEKAIQAFADAVTATKTDSQTGKRPFVSVYDEHQTRSKTAKTASDDTPTQR